MIGFFCIGQSRRWAGSYLPRDFHFDLICQGFYDLISGPSILAYLSGSAKATLLSPISLRLRISARCARLSFLRALLRVSFDQCLVSASSIIFFSRITYSLRTWAAQVLTHRWQHRRSGIEIRISSSSLLQPHHR